MKTQVIQRQIHISPRKLGLICDLVRGKSAIQAQTILFNLDKKGTEIVLKLLQSAVANATNNFGMDVTKLYILHILANQGTTIKRTLPRAKGSASLMRKRHSHLLIVISDDLNDKKTLNKLPNAKTKISKKAEAKKQTVTNNSPKIKFNELPVVETPIEKVSPAKEVKIAAEIEAKEENK
jgi:ribosomal protein L22